jgi:hypothetical protein
LPDAKERQANYSIYGTTNLPPLFKLATLATKLLEDVPGVSRIISESAPSWEALARESLAIMPRELKDETLIGETIKDSPAYQAPDFLAAANRLENPYLTEFNALQDDPDYQLALSVARYRKWSAKLTPIAADIKQNKMRRALTDKYSWSVPNSEALTLTAEQGPLIEAGAGSGYWAHLLQNMGADVLPFDKYGNNTVENYYASGATKAWTNIITGGAETVATYPNRTLFMSFPPAEEPFAADVLKTYAGKKFVFVGETCSDSCTGDKEFHSLLASQWREVKSVKIPNWTCPVGIVEDAAYLFERL